MDTKQIIKQEKEYVIQTYSRNNIVIDHGKECYVFDKSGKKYIDLIGGIATCPLGHGNKQFADVIKKQLLKVTNPTNLYYSEEQVILAKKLTQLSGLHKCFFSNSGTESVETAIKLARKHTKKYEIISTKNAFHGRTFGSLAATGKEEIKKAFNPMLPGFKHVEYGDSDAIEKSISKNTAAVIIEPIQGEAGVIVPEDEYLKKLRAICNKHGILLIIDEIQTGCGRTGKFFAYENSKIKPDIVTLAKGLANGLPIGATIVHEKIAKSIKPGDHGSTFGGNPVSCKAANFTIDYIIKNNLMLNATIQGNYFMKKLKTIGHINKIRGKGLMIAAEANNAKKIVKKCLDAGLLINSTSDKVLRFLPPIIMNKEIIDKSIKILKKVIDND